MVPLVRAGLRPGPGTKHGGVRAGAVTPDTAGRTASSPGSTPSRERANPGGGGGPPSAPEHPPACGGDQGGGRCLFVLFVNCRFSF